MKDVVITTTNNIERCPVLEYIGFVCTNVVLGVNVFSDIAASFTDFFGGKSASYQNKLELIQKDVIKDLKYKAQNIGANAILSCRIDFDEISGGGKSMFMVSASGTACRIDISNLRIKEPNDSLYYGISKEQLNFELRRESVIYRINKNDTISDDDYEFLMNHPQDELVRNLIQKYYNSIQYYMEVEYRRKVIALLSKTSRSKLIEECYSLIIESIYVSNIINDLDLFSADKILELCNSGHFLALVLKILNSENPYYNRQEVEMMKKIVYFCDSLPDTGRIENVKGLLGKESKKFICSKGHKMAVDVEYCSVCAVNIKGLTLEQVEKINLFKNKVKILDMMIKER
jgi:uncharacterized protein YbjQ (UPF0145 family)